MQHSHRMFSTNKSQQKSKLPDEKDPYEEEEVEQVQYEHQEEPKQSFNEFKWYRKILFMIGKTIKWTCWAAFLMYFYHMYLINYSTNPDGAFLANDTFLHAARQTRYSYNEFKYLLTRPPVDRLLLDRMPLPPGYQHPKTLVLNLNGTLIHSSYKLGVGFEILKRPGLAMFLSTMARNYELVVFGDQEIHVSKALANN